MHFFFLNIMSIKIDTGSGDNQVQLSITKLQIDGEYKGNCLFAGLAIYQEQREDLLLCTNRSLWTNKTITITGNQQSFVSKTSCVILVHYDMRKYTKAMVTFTITTSKCTGILINPCEFEAYCSIWLLTNLSLCDSYLKSFSSKYVKVVKEERYVMVSMNLILVQNNQTDYKTCIHLILSSNVIARL